MKKLLLALLAGLVLLLALALTTTQGLRLLLATASWLLPGEIQISRMSGSLIGPLDMEGVSYSDAAVAVQIDTLGLDWQPAALFGTRLHVRHARADGINIQVLAAPSEQAAEPVSLKSLLGAIEVEDLSLSNISLLGYGATEAIVIDRLHLTATGNEPSLQIQAFSLEAPLFSLQVEGLVSLETETMSHLTTEWWVQLPNMPRLVGTGTLQGDVHTLQVDQAISGPATVVLRASLKDLLEQLQWNATAEVNGFNLQLLQPDGPQRLLSASLKASGGLDAFTLSGNTRLTDPSWGAIDSDLQLDRTPDHWRLERLVLNNPQLPGKVSITGGLDSGGEISAHAEWSDLAWQLADQQSLQSPSGELLLDGRLDDYRFQGSALLESSGYPQLTVTAKGTGNRQGLKLDELQGVSSEGSFASSAIVAWAPAVEWQVLANVREFNPAFFVPGRTGKLSFRLQSDGGQPEQALQGTLVIDEVAGTLQGQPVSGKTHAGFSGSNLTISDAQFAVGSTRVSASGSVDTDWKLQWDITTQNLGLLVAGARGVLQGQGSLSGPRDTPRIEARLGGSDLHLQDIDVQSLQANVDVDLADRLVSKIDVKASGLRASGKAIDSLTLSADGTLSRHAIQFALQQDTQQLTGSIAAKYAAQAWSGTLESLRLPLTAEQTWSLQSPADFAVEPGRVVIQTLCLVQADARLCSEAGWQVSGWTVAVDGEHLPAALLQPWLEPGIAVDSEFSLRLRGQSAGTGLTGTARLDLAAGSITLDDGEETLVLAQFGPGYLDARLQDNRLDGTLDLPLQDKGGVTGQLQMRDVVSADGWFAAKTTVASGLKLNFVDTGLIAVLVPDISTSKGEVAGDLAISGTLGNPLFNGNVSVNKGEVTLPQPGIRLTDITMQLTGDGNTLSLKGAFTSGEGVASYQGQVVMLPGVPLSLEMSISGDNVQLVNVPEITLSASPDIKLALHEQRLDVTGTVRVPAAQIRLRELKGVEKESTDLVLSEEQAVAAQTGKIEVYSNVTLVLEDKVSFSGFGLEGNIEGKVAVLEEPGKVTRGQGELNIIGGTYKLYGQKLDIEKGRLVFAGGPIANPGLDMRVVRVSGDVLAGVRVTGSAETPKLTLFSEPSMEQSDMLSYLLLGVPTSQASGAQGAALSGAAASLGLTGGEMLAGKLGSAFGLEEVRIDSGDTLEDSSLVLGKYLSPRMYVSYAVGLFTQSNTFRIRYTLSKRWSVQTETGVVSGADLFYSLEND